MPQDIPKNKAELRLTRIMIVIALLIALAAATQKLVLTLIPFPAYHIWVLLVTVVSPLLPLSLIGGTRIFSAFSHFSPVNESMSAAPRPKLPLLLTSLCALACLVAAILHWRMFLPGRAPSLPTYALGFSGILWALLLFYDYRKTAGEQVEDRVHEGLCPECGYDLRGDLDRGCPECGWGREAASRQAD